MKYEILVNTSDNGTACWQVEYETNNALHMEAKVEQLRAQNKEVAVFKDGKRVKT